VSRFAPLLLLVLGLGLTGAAGCRYEFEHVREGRLPSRDTIALLQSGTTLAATLDLAGAPDGILWLPGADVLVYDRVDQLRSRWELENPLSFAARVSPTAVAGEVVTLALYTVARSGRQAPVRRGPPSFVPQTTPTFTSRPLTLEGDQVGREQVLLVFDRATQRLRWVEVVRGRPETDVGGTASGTFLR
jgi:hypothetical protein